MNAEMNAAAPARSMSASPQSTHQTNEQSDFDVRIELVRHRAFLTTSVLVFVASAAMTFYWCNSMAGGMVMPGGWTMSMTWMRMQGQSWFDAASSFLGMWVVMMAAMMLPALLPALLRYRLSLRGPQSADLASLTTLVGAAFVFVWALIGAAVYPIGVVLAKAVMASEMFARYVPIAAGVVLLLAGYLQVTKWKVRQLCRCRAASAGGRALRRDSRGAWYHGIRLGGDCALCCSGLMAVVLVTGVMNLGTMALVTVAIATERLFPRPERSARTTGLVIIAAGVFMIGRSLNVYWRE
jgi:predicted metal-binding membrane protein